ncbi:MAG: TIGR00153 family protein [Phycisphaerales bacterium]|jgi:predicted phosphate transport protein (TIGR00153 family)
MSVNAMARLFGRSPFVPLQLHLDKISDCVEAAVVLLEKIRLGDLSNVDEEARAISKLEHKADLVKNDIRNNLPRGLFMAIDRGQLLEILSLQDSIADKAEDIAVLMSIRPVKVLESLSEPLKEYIEGNLRAFHKLIRVMRELDVLIESGFGGAEANKVNAMIEDVAIAEHKCDIMQRILMKSVLDHEEELSVGDFFIWQRLLLEISGISNYSEKLANRVRMLLTLK